MDGRQGVFDQVGGCPNSKLRARMHCQSITRYPSLLIPSSPENLSKALSRLSDYTLGFNEGVEDEKKQKPKGTRLIASVNHPSRSTQDPQYDNALRR